jgi:hypothetical protein
VPNATQRVTGSMLGLSLVGFQFSARFLEAHPVACVAECHADEANASGAGYFAKCHSESYRFNARVVASRFQFSARFLEAHPVRCIAECDADEADASGAGGRAQERVASE